MNVLQGSRARRLYERLGFVLDHEDAIDVYLTARATSECHDETERIAGHPASVAQPSREDLIDEH